MSNADFTATSPAGDDAAAASANEPATSGGSSTPTSTHDLGQLPERVRVHALAKLLGSNSREVLGKLGELGETARSPQSSVPRAVAWRVAEMFEAGDQVPEQPGSDPASSAVPEQATGQLSLEEPEPEPPAAASQAEEAQAEETQAERTQAEETQAEETEPLGGAHVPVFAAPSPVFLPPEPESQPRETTARQQQASAPSEEREDTAGKQGGKSKARQAGGKSEQEATAAAGSEEAGDTASGDQADESGESDDSARRRRRRGRRGRGRGKGGEDAPADAADGADADTPAGEQADKQAKQDKQNKQDKGQSKGQADKATDTKTDTTAGKKDQAVDQADDASSDEGESKRRRRRRRRKGNGDDDSTGDDPPNTVTHVREKSNADRDSDSDGVRSVRGSTRLEAKRQRRRDGREAGRRRAPILSEAEFLARRESVERTMVVAEKDGATQIGVLEDGVLVEHFVTSAGSGSIVGNVYLGRVQNVLPSMEAAFIDIGRGRNAVLYAGEVDWDSAGLEGKARKIEQALSSGDHVLVQVTKDPLGHKGARLTTQISLPGRFLVYVPSGGTTGISRKLPENERRRLKDILKRVVPEDAGVIIRTASEGISETELERDVQRLREQWENIKERSATTSASQSKKSGAPALLYEEPDLLIKVVRDLFTEDFVKMEIQGERAWETIHGYVQRVAPELTERLKRYVGTGQVLADYRIDEQISKALDRKVWLPSGGYLVIDRTEAMTVIDVNTGKFTGSGGNLEETVTRNNLESAEEIVRQLRLRDIGGIIVIDFIDMVLESNRELVLRRLTECLGRDRTRHQVAEVTSLGLVQMTRKRIGTGLLESFSTTCEHCKGRGLHISTEPQSGSNGGQQQSGSRKQRGKSEGSSGSGQVSSGPTQHQRESAAHAVAAMANASKAAKPADADSQHTASEPAEASAPAVPAADATPVGEDSGAGGKDKQDKQDKQDKRPQQQAQEPEQPAGEPAARSTRRRARRAASRPAGPPVE